MIYFSNIFSVEMMTSKIEKSFSTDDVITGEEEASLRNGFPSVEEDGVQLSCEGVGEEFILFFLEIAK